jgi:hypothetical protein
MGRAVPSGPRTLIRDQGQSDPYRAVAESRIAEHIMGRERSPDRVGPTHEDEPAVADP